jgi:diguanylate cyclase (GGDEF)-like protein/PAS domain S-box-containing protein
LILGTRVQCQPMTKPKGPTSGAPKFSFSSRAALLRNVVENAAVPTFVADTNGDLVYANRAFCDLLGYEPGGCIGLGIKEIVHPEDATSAAAQIESVVGGEVTGYQTERRYLRQNGDAIWVLTSVSALPSVRGQSDYLTVQAVDIDRRKHAEKKLQFANTLLSAAMETSPDGILVIDTNLRIISYNRRFAEVWRIPLAILQAHEDAALLAAVASSVKNSEAFISRVAHFYQHPEEEGHDELETKDGRFIDRNTGVLRGDDGTYLGRIWFFRDITERRQADALLLKSARCDALTGLPNRVDFMEAVEQAIARTKRGGQSFAVLYLDLDQFKDVNDTLGHSVGDELLKAVAERLRSQTRETDVVARFGGDEFAVMVADVGEPEAAAFLAGKLIDALTQPFVVQGNDICSGASIGVSVFGADEPNAETMLTRADLALYRAKSDGAGDYRFFTDAMDADVRARVTLVAELREAIPSGQLFLEYQPQVEIVTGRITGVEALVRWRHPTRGVLAPGFFIPAAEKSSLIALLGRWVLREACQQAKAWLDAGVSLRVMAVNLSAVQFKRTFELEKDVRDILAETGLPAQQLELELTETVLMAASREHNDFLERLRANGVRIAIDDFGVGYSSLDYLRQFPVDRIKIAQAFVEDIASVLGSAAIVRATIGLARELCISVIAEGVETTKQLDLLSAWGCREAQGYYFAKPLSVQEMTSLLRRGVALKGRASSTQNAA